MMWHSGNYYKSDSSYYPKKFQREMDEIIKDDREGKYLSPHEKELIKKYKNQQRIKTKIPFGKQKVSQALPLVKLVAEQNNLNINRSQQFKMAVHLAEKRYNQ